MRILRKILYPFAILYGLVTTIRNFFFDKGVLKSKEYDIPVIAIGNLNVGGTGKSPMIEFLIRLLKEQYKIATLSRGYRRKSVGFVLANAISTAEDLGDEPMQFHTKFTDISVAVDADRQNGIAQLIKNVNPEVILLDDAYQHRKVTAGFYVLLTKYNDLYVNDMILPAGNLRESKKGAIRADVIIVTKCPENLSLAEQENIKAKLNPKSNQKVFFTAISYDEKVYGKGNSFRLNDLKNVTLVTGIANPKPLIAYLNKIGLSFNHLAYKDHHHFSSSEINMLAEKELVLTTEKDYMRLKDRLENVYYLPIKSMFLNNENVFNAQVFSFIKKKKAL